MIISLTPQIAVDDHPETGSSSHVLLVVDEIRKILGGGERIALKIAELLPQYGYRASILTFSADVESAAVRSAPCPVYLLPLQRTYDLKAFRSALELRKFIRRQEIGIVQTFFESSDLWAGLVSRTTRAHLIWSRRDMGILRARKHEVMYRWMANLPHAVFAVSEQVRDHAIQVDGVESARVHTIYNGIDLDGWKRRERSVDVHGYEMLITTVGNIRRVKGHDLFIKAAVQLAQKFPAASFSIAGDILEQDYFAELQGLIRQSRLEGRFHFVGGITDIRSHLMGADVFVLPSRSEGFSNAIIEAMAASLPVVATDVGGNAEAVKTGETGYIVPAENADALAAALDILLTDPQKARQMGAAGRRLVEENFTTAAMMRRIVAKYETIAKQ